MKKMFLTLTIALAAVAAKAESHTYECNQVRTTAEEAVARTPLKAFKLTADERGVRSTSGSRIVEMDQRLLTGGAPMKHITYGGYLRTAAGEVFLCERDI